MNDVAAPLAHTVDSACRRIAVGRTSMYQLITDGRIVPIHVGRRTLIPESELERFLAEEVAAAKAARAAA